MDIRVLGSLEVLDGSSGGRRVPVPRRKQRLLLGLLALRANATVSTDAIIEGLWPRHPPPSARANLQSYLSGLRRALASGEDRTGPRLDTAPGGYVLRSAREDIDALRFTDAVDEAAALMRARCYDAAAARLAAGLRLWRGDVLDGLPVPEAWQPDVALLAERRLDAVEDSFDAALALGHARCLIADVRAQVDRHPLRERLWGQLMLALYRAGRQAEAVTTYHRLRRLLADELGIEPSAPVTELWRRILSGDPALAFVLHDHRT